MNVVIKTTNFDLTPSVSEYVEKKATAIKKLIDPSDTTAHCAVEVGKPSKRHQSGDIFYAEFNVTVAGGRYRASASEATIYAAIDEAKDEIVRELRRHKRKRLNLLRRGGARLKGITHGISASGARLKGFIIRDRRQK